MNNRVCLNDDVKPTHYDLDLTVHDLVFEGFVSILCKAIRSITSFEFNSKALNLKKLQIFVDEVEIPCDYKIITEGSKKNEFVTVTFQKSISSDFILKIQYSGEYGNLDGFYKSDDMDGDFLFSTQFEPTDARKAFPCFDQPDMKATFKISINCPAKYIALGNMETEYVEEMNSRKIYHFKPTPIMSTYIVAWVIGKLDYIKKSDDKVTIRVFCKKNELDWAQYSLDVAYDCLKFFEQYFKIDYPLKKLDLVSIPSFASGAMENWGLITFRKTSLLFSPTTSFIRSKKNIANTVCHELAHMWFGNLVTMKWWNDLWLNEGFATWAASLALEHLNKNLVNWDQNTNFASTQVENGLIADCLKDTHQISVEVTNPDEIDQIFNEISYDKGSSIIRMLENWLGAEQFKLGIRRYLHEKKYGNSETIDLWKALDAEKTNESLPINILVDHWINRDGFPYIKIEETDNAIILTQARFTKGYEIEDEPWPIPLLIRWFTPNGEEIEKVLFNTKTMTLSKKGSAYKLNDNMSSFIRVQYPKLVFTNLFTKFNLSDINLLNLIADMFELGFALKDDFKFDLLSIMSKSNNYEILENILINLNVLKNAFYDIPEYYNKFSTIQNDIIKARLMSIDLKQGNKSVNELSIDSLFVSIGVANKIYHIESDNIHQEFIKSFYISQVDSNFEKVKHAYETLTYPGVKESALVALGKINIRENFNKLFGNNGIETLKFIKKYDINYFAFSMGSNRLFRNDFALYVIKHFDELEKFINDSGMFRSLIHYAFISIYEPQTQSKVIEFLTKLENMQNGKKYERTINKIKNNFTAINNLRARIINQSKAQMTSHL